MQPPRSLRPVSSKGVVLYDGDCGFCSRWLRFWTPTLERNGFAVDTLQAPWLPDVVNLRPSDLLADIRLLRPDDALVSGADAYLYVMSRIWWARPFSVVCRLPGFDAIFRAGYRSFARNRYCISRQCSIR
jgi:predicted DCC family thiol-disulfide oxidoreductase YuxK